MTETLKPCPFCGDKAVLKEDLRWHGAFRVECSSCDATVWATGENNPASAIAHWNTRAAPREPGEAERLIAEWYAAWKAEFGAWRDRARAASSDARLFANAARVHDDARARLLVAESGMANFVEAPRPDAGDGTGEP